MYLHLGTLGQGTLKEDSLFFVCGGGGNYQAGFVECSYIVLFCLKKHLAWDAAPWLSLCVQNFLHSKNRANTVLNSWNGSNKFGNSWDMHSLGRFSSVSRDACQHIMELRLCLLSDWQMLGDCYLSPHGLQWCILAWLGLNFWSILMLQKVFKDRMTSQMLQINVALPNGHTELLSLLPSSTVQDLRIKAQRTFAQKCLRLITAKNVVLVDPDITLEETEIEDGECLTALVLQPQLAATRSAFALWCHGDRAIVTWGSPGGGGNSSAVQDQLKGVQQIHATHRAFAALLEDRSVVTWGDAAWGGDRSVVGDELKGVQQIQATNSAFAAILEDGSVVTWGDEDFGGDSSAVQDQLKGVLQIQSTDLAFAAILSDGSVVTWGDAAFGGHRSGVGDELKGVSQIQATRKAFAAILEDGSVVTWVDADWGGDSSAVRDQLKGVLRIQASYGAFAAILEDGSVVTWGGADWGGDSSAVRDQLKGVLQIQASYGAFAAILEDGSVVTWWPGRAASGGDSSAVQDQLKAVMQIQATEKALCCDSRRWVRRYLGWWKIWRWQLGSSRSAQGCAADSGHLFCLCCDSWRWIRCDLGWCKMGRWQFCSSRSAQWCAANSSHGSSLCSHSDRSIHRYLGWPALWRWQFGSSTWAQVCVILLCMQESPCPLTVPPTRMGPGWKVMSCYKRNLQNPQRLVLQWNMNMVL